MSEIAAGASASSLETNPDFETGELDLEGSFDTPEADAANGDSFAEETTFFSDLGLPEIILDTLTLSLIHI